MADKAQIGIRSQTLDSLIGEMHNKGTLRIPRFQRDYVWERTRVAQLLDSIYKQFPIGSFFFWITPREYRDLYRELPELKLPDPAGYEQIKMILDGQQRITSLYVVARGLVIRSEGKSEKDYRKICFDLDTEKFFVAPRGEDRERTIAVWRFFDWQGGNELYSKLTDERRQIFDRCKHVFSTYPVSIVEVEGMGLDDAVAIFERINQGGKKLSLFDLVVASTWSTDFDLKERVREANARFDRLGFGAIDEEIYAQLLALVVKGQCTKAAQLELKNEEIKEIWDEVVRSVELTIDYFRKNLGVAVYEFIPYPAMLTMVAYLYFQLSSRALSDRQAAFVQEWFWRAALSQRYASSTLTIMGEDRKDYFDRVVAEEEVHPDYPVVVTTKDITGLLMYTRSAIKNAILCLLVLRQPRHFKNGSLIALDRMICSDLNDLQRHHIFPNAYLRGQDVKTRHLVANFAFIPGELNREISDKKPSDYFTEYAAGKDNYSEILASHLIPDDPDSGIWTNDFDKFLVERSALILRELEKLVGKISDLQAMSEEDPNQALNVFEKSLRDFIDQRLKGESEKDYWKSNIPGAVQDNVKRRMESDTKRLPYSGAPVDPRQRLDYVDFSEYYPIIKANWDIFGEHFINQNNCLMHLDNLMVFRNAEKHVREKDQVMKKLGEGSLEWFFRIIQPDSTDSGSEHRTTATVPDAGKKFFCRYEGVLATGELLEENAFRVEKGSGAAAQSADSFATHHYSGLRADLISQGILMNTEDPLVLRFESDYIFSSPSAAAAVVLARAANGKTVWKDEQGNSIKDN